MEQMVRRMVFVSNRNLIQSEAVLVPPNQLPTAGPATSPPASAAQGKKSGKQGSKRKLKQPLGNGCHHWGTLAWW